VAILPGEDPMVMVSATISNEHARAWLMVDRNPLLESRQCMQVMCIYHNDEVPGLIEQMRSGSALGVRVMDTNDAWVLEQFFSLDGFSEAYDQR
jgi:invasion protein IalB